MMESEDEKLALELQRGQQAHELLQNPLWNQIMHELDAGFIDGWRSMKLSDTEGRERAWMAVQVLDQIRKAISGLIEDAKIAGEQNRQEEIKARREALRIIQLEEAQYK